MAADGWPYRCGNSLVISSPKQKNRTRHRTTGELLLLTGASSGGAGEAVGNREVGAKDGGEGQRVREVASLHIVVQNYRREAPGCRRVRHCRAHVGGGKHHDRHAIRCDGEER